MATLRQHQNAGIVGKTPRFFTGKSHPERRRQSPAPQSDYQLEIRVRFSRPKLKLWR
jgi:hypothetical protein